MVEYAKLIQLAKEAEQAGSWLCPCCGERGPHPTAVMALPPDGHACDRSKTGPFGVWQ